VTRRKREQRREVAFRPNTVTKEDLPFPIVLYPGHYGAFFGFRKDEGSPTVLCSCALPALEGYLKLRLSRPIPSNREPAREFVLDPMYFPLSLVKNLMQKKAPNNYRVLDHLQFEDGLCHECNRAMPTYRYCHEMYGGLFKQNYGWYINKQAFEYGIHPITGRVIPELCPQEILELIEIDPEEANEKIRRLSMNAPLSEELKLLKKRLEKQNRAVFNYVENEVRIKFGHKKIGEAWTNETALYLMVKSIFPGLTVRRHYKPPFLQGLELDIFVEELNLGIEYQGAQHFKPVPHWGGEEAFRRLKERDQRKQKLCRSAGVTLVYFTYRDDLTPEFVRSRLRKKTGAP